MKNSIKINLEELIEESILTDEQATKIQAYYKKDNLPSENRLLVIFGVLGALLIGLGIILIIAHNWDDFSRTTRTFLAFLPLLIGQSLVGYTFFKKKENQAWQETAATFLFFGVGACISMVSQIYNLHGELHTFLLVWILLTIPLVYVMQSAMVSLLIICWTGWYAFGYKDHIRGEAFPWLYLLLMGLILPFFYQLWKKAQTSNSFHFHLWFWSVSIALVMATFIEEENFAFLSYAGLFGLYFLLGSKEPLASRSLRANPLLLLGAIGSLVLFLLTSFGDIMKEIRSDTLLVANLFSTPSFYIVIILLLANLYLLSKFELSKKITHIHPLKFAYIAFCLSFLIGKLFGLAILSNLFLLWTGVFYIFRGEKKQHLGWLNFGLLILAVLITCRFFDVDMSFVMRGILFILLGCGFLFANLRIIQARKLKNIQ